MEKGDRRNYLIKTKVAKKRSDDGFKETGCLVFGNPTKVSLNEFGQYAIVRNFRSHRFYEYMFMTMEAEDKWRVIGTTQATRHIYGYDGTFELIQVKKNDPPILLVAMLSFTYATLSEYMQYG